jgi:hypothetical protein
MAIPVTFLTAVIKKSEIRASYPGGLDQFLRDHPDASRDEHLFGVSFMSGGEIQEFVDIPRSRGFDVRRGRAIGELFHGEWAPCDGIEFVRAGSEGPFTRWEARYLRKCER